MNDEQREREAEGAAQAPQRHDDRGSSPGLELPERLRELLLAPEETERMFAPGSKEAAVLVPLLERNGELVAVFTRRARHLPQHAGEISFPGGRLRRGESALAAALREAEEEIGLAPARVEVVGALPPTGTIVTAFRVRPYVGWVAAPPASWRPAADEVEAVLELPLRALAAGFRLQRLVRLGVPIRTPTYTVGEHVVWGATARIVRALLRRLTPLDSGTAGEDDAR